MEHEDLKWPVSFIFTNVIIHTCARRNMLFVGVFVCLSVGVYSNVYPQNKCVLDGWLIEVRPVYAFKLLIYVAKDYKAKMLQCVP